MTSAPRGGKQLEAREQWWIGYDEGYRRGYYVGSRCVPDHIVNDRARELLAQERKAMQRFARREAMKSHGPAWAALVTEEEP